MHAQDSVLWTQSCAGNIVPGADFRVDDPHEKTRFAEFRPSLALRPVASPTGRSVALGLARSCIPALEILLESQTRVW